MQELKGKEIADIQTQGESAAQNEVLLTEYFVSNESDRAIVDGILKGGKWVIDTFHNVYGAGLSPKIYVLNNRGFSQINDTPFPRSMVVKGSTGQFQAVQLPNNLSRLKPSPNLELTTDGTVLTTSTVSVPGLFGEKKHVASDNAIIYELFGVEECAHAICQQAGFGFLFAKTNVADGIKHVPPKSQAEEDYSPSEFVALLVQSLYISEVHPDEAECLQNIAKRVNAVLNLLSRDQYPRGVDTSVGSFLTLLKEKFPENRVFQLEQITSLIEGAEKLALGKQSEEKMKRRQ